MIPVIATKTTTCNYCNEIIPKVLIDYLKLYDLKKVYIKTYTITSSLLKTIAMPILSTISLRRKIKDLKDNMRIIQVADLS